MISFKKESRFYLYRVSDDGAIFSRCILIGEEKILVGRGELAGVRILEDVSLSGEHFSVRLRNGTVVISDLHSTNGTYVNDQRLTGEWVLTPRDRVRAGRSHFTISAKLAARIALAKQSARKTAK